MIEWRKIPGFTRYSVSEHGEVRRDACPHCGTKERVHALNLNDRDYYKVSIVDDEGRHITRTVHTFVALAFIGPRPEGMIICHRDGVHTHNHYTNLRYDTYGSNSADARKHGKIHQGSKARAAKLVEADIPQIIDLLGCRLFTQEEIGKMYGVSQGTVLFVANGHTWKHITNGKAVPHIGRDRKRSGQSAVRAI